MSTLPTFVSLKPNPIDFLRNCIYCRLAKAKRNSITGAVSRPMQLGTDPKGLYDTPSLINGSIYVFSVISLKTRPLTQYYIKKKSYNGLCLKTWYNNCITAFRLTYKDELTHISLNTDMDESASNNIIAFLAGVGIELMTTCPHVPQQYMVIEMVWRSIGGSAIAMLFTADLTESYCEEA